MNEVVRDIEAGGLRWYPQYGFGYLPVHQHGEKHDYWDHYMECQDSAIGRQLNRFRVRLVKTYVPDGLVLDIGIGSGAFIRAHGNALGFDVDPQAVDWLRRNELYFTPYDPYQSLDRFDAVTLWDSLEHMRCPALLLDSILPGQYVFVSLPIFDRMEDVPRSKHYKPHEHYLYFTAGGLKAYMARYDLHCSKETWEETEIGREDIGTFVFRKAEKVDQHEYEYDEARRAVCAAC